MTYRVHLDGYNLMPARKGEAAWPRHEFIYGPTTAASQWLHWAPVPVT